MASALLAKLKINNPPEKNQEFVINVRPEPGKVVAPELGKAVVAPQPGKAVVAPQPGKVLVVPEPVVKIRDESKQTDFDRATFLKRFHRSKIINTLAPAVPVPAPALAPAVPAPVPALAPVVPVPALAPVVPVPVPALAPAPVPAVEKKKQTTRKNKTVKAVPVTVEEEELPALAPAVPAVPALAPAVPALANAPAVPAMKVTAARRTKKPVVGVQEGPLSLVTIGDTAIETRLQKKNPDKMPVVAASAYYLNNREIFVNFMTSIFNKYKKKLADEAAAPASCPGDDVGNEISLMTHQRIVRDYLNLYSPYRGLLLYHGLGSGKTCSSIAIAEGLKSVKPIIVMTPASLQVNYREELKKCGDDLYRKNQFWEFIPTGAGAVGTGAELIENLSKILGLPVDFIIKAGGAWLVNMSKPANYDSLSPTNKLSLEKQIDEMIAHKYSFINYNGLRATRIVELTQNNTVNPFDNAVVIVDEAHNLVSRIVNKIGKKTGSIAISLYSLLMKAKNAKIILLSGTPIINYPNEISILFNILRGYIISWSLKLEVIAQRQVNTEFFKSIFKSTILGGNVIDLIEYNPTSTTLVITRNPFGFVNKTTTTDTYAGVKLEIGERGEMSDATFIELVTKILQKNNIKVQANGIQMKEYKALPDTLDQFKSYFIEANGDIKNSGMFKRRILGLTSYFRSAQESLMPRYVKSNPKDFQIIKIPMSDFQLEIYEEARIQERTQDMKNASKKKFKQAGADGVYENTSSTYRIFSRAFCNFVFPRPVIRRPMPDKKNQVGEETDLSDVIDEDVIDAVTTKEKQNRDESYEEGAEGAEGERAEGAEDTEGAEGVRVTYRERIQHALEMLEKDRDKYLTPTGLEVYSPKFLHILENIQDAEHAGIHLVYSQFRALEGIGILKLVLETNGFAQFKIKKMGETWDFILNEADVGKPLFALYTGTETPEEKEIIRNVLNNAWKYVPATIVKKIEKIAPNNTMGEIIKVLMITSSGAEGISLKNVRYVHITEPYWHPVRMEQVIGRARRICSHQALPAALRTVNVFLYLMTFSAHQLESKLTKDLRLNDRSRDSKIKVPISTDEALYEIASIKEEITKNIMTAVKESSIDCALHIKSNTTEKLQCFTFGSNDSAKFAYKTAFEEGQSDAIADINKKEITIKATKITTEDGTEYALNQKTNELYDLDSYENGQPVKVGDLIIKGKGKDATIEFKFI